MSDNTFENEELVKPVAEKVIPGPGAEFTPVANLLSDDEALKSSAIGTRRGADPNILQFFLILNVGLILTAISIVIFKTPNHYAFGGTSGLSVILTGFFPNLPVSIFMWIINIVLIVLGLIFLDKKAVGWSIFASVALSAYVSLIEWMFPLNQSLTGDMWLDLCFAVILPAIGSALVFDIGASTGGTDILAMILRKRTSMEIGKALMVVDLGIVLVAAWMFGPRTGLYCILGLFGKTLVVDTFIESIHMRKVCTVICSFPDQVEEFIVRNLNRSATITYGYGAYSGKEFAQIMSVLSRKEAVALRNYVRSIDSHAFITIVNSSEIVGKGFRGTN